MKYYLRIFENKKFGFVVEGINKVIDTDIRITKSEYDEFFKLQAKGKQFKVKDNVEGSGGLFHYIEEISPTPITLPPDIEERITALEQLMMGVL